MSFHTFFRLTLAANATKKGTHRYAVTRFMVFCIEEDNGPDLADPNADY